MQAAEKVETSYLCGSCGVKVDAITRQQRIKAVPPFLTLQLQRFVYDMEARTLPSVAIKSSMILHLRIFGPIGHLRTPANGGQTRL